MDKLLNLLFRWWPNPLFDPAFSSSGWGGVVSFLALPLSFLLSPPRLDPPHVILTAGKGSEMMAQGLQSSQAKMRKDKFDLDLFSLVLGVYRFSEDEQFCFPSQGYFRYYPIVWHFIFFS